jgi:type 1 glutamine amidotransferase
MNTRTLTIGALGLVAATLFVATFVTALPVAAQSSAMGPKKVLFLAGRPSHDYGSHEHYAGCLVLAKNLEAAMPDFDAEVIRYEWPPDPQAFEGVSAVVMYCDGGSSHPVIPNLRQIDALADRGVGIVCIHYGVEVPKGDPGDHFLKWIGGYFEAHWSVNPHWKAEFKQLPDHPITRGVQPFSVQDEWYYHMRFRSEMKGVTPILTAIPPASTLERPDGPHSGNPHVRAEAGKPQHVAWAAEREENGGRGFGFTGGHFHWNWGLPNVRRLMLNAIVWTAHGEVPQQGVGAVEPLTVVDLQADQDESPPREFDAQSISRDFGIDAGK